MTEVRSDIALNGQTKIKGGAPSLMFVSLNTHKVPVFAESNLKDWIIYGKSDEENINNRYPDYLLALYNRCSTHSAIINSKVDYICGGGFNEIKDKKLQLFIDKINSNESLKELTHKLVLDFEIFKGFAIEIVYTNGGTISTMNHIDFSKIRVSKDYKKYYYSPDWSKYNPETQPGWRVYDAFDINVRKGIQLLCYKGYSPGIKFYPIPEYIGGIPAIETEIEIYNFHYNNIKNGFVGGHIISFNNGEPTDEEKKKLEKQLKAKFAGTDNAGGIVMIFSDGKDRAPEILSLQGNEFDKRFEQLASQVQAQIFITHRVTSPMLFGVKVAGQLGGRTELIEANELFVNRYVKPKQKELERVLNLLVSINGLPQELKLVITPPIGISFGEDKMWEIMTFDEKREKFGLPQIEEPKQTTELRRQCSPNELLQAFKKYGKPKKKYKILKQRHSFSSDEVTLIEYFDKAIEAKLKPIDRAIMDLLVKDALMPPEEMAKVLKISVKEVENNLNKLISDGLVKEGTKKSGDDKIPKYVVTSPGKDILKSKPAKTLNVFVMYSYEFAPRFKNADPSTSRDFCKELMDEDKLYTRSEIETLSAETGWNVWEMRGGWYHDPQKDVNVPQCRHIWLQNVVSEEQ